ncbi:MAG: DUF4136 domain-containing protein [Zoogloeaceae bacterium]|jgi:hypothetical protein|nr:DUF4136 domain-containing protein [Zoogloeaceae bacterium]
MPQIRFLFLLLLAFLLGGCATTLTPEIRSHVNPDADFSRYRSFAFFSPLGTDKDGYGSILSRHLRDATRRALEARGYRYTETEPDLLVNFSADAVDKADVVSFSSMGHYGYRGHWHGLWHGHDTTMLQYQEGSLNLDLIDARQKQLVWEGIAEGRITEHARQNLEATVQSIVEGIFRQYPYQAQGTEAR